MARSFDKRGNEISTKRGGNKNIPISQIYMGPELTYTFQYPSYYENGARIRPLRPNELMASASQIITDGGQRYIQPKHED